MLEQRHTDLSLLYLGVADAVDEVADGARCEAAAAHTRDGGHTGIVPAVHQPFLHQLQQLALAHHGVGEIQAVELDLSRAVDLRIGYLAHEAVVERTVRHKLQRAYRVGHTLEVVALAVSEVVHGINVPFAARAVVGCLDDAVHDGVAEVHVVRCHVDARTQHAAPLVKFAGVHPLEQVEILLHRSAAVGAVGAGSGGRALLSCDLLRGLVVDVGLPLLDHTYCQIVELGEVVRSIVFAVAPVESEPVDILADSVDILRILFRGVGVVEAQVAGASKLLGNTKVHAYSLGMANVEIAVGLRRETRIETSAVFAGRKVVGHNLFHKVQSLGALCRHFLIHFLCHNGDI